MILVQVVMKSELSFKLKKHGDLGLNSRDVFGCNVS